MGDTHWTDNAAQPVFTTRIPLGNAVEMAGIAGRLLREIGVPADRITKLYRDVIEAANHDQALAFIEAWFPIERGGER